MDPSLALPFSPLKLASIGEDWWQGNYAQVATYLQQQIEQGSDAPETYWCLGSVYCILGQELEAQLIWQEGVLLWVAAGGSEPEATHRLAKALEEMGEDLWGRGHWPQAATLYRQLLDLRDAFPEPEVSSAQVLAAHRIGLTQGRSRLWSSAATWFEQACQRDPTAAESFLQWGLALIKLGRWREAIESLQRAAYLQPDDGAEPWVQLGMVWLDLGDPQQAILCFEAAAVRDPLAKGLYSYWVEALIHLDQPDAALEMLGRAVETEQEWLQAWWRALAQRDQKRDSLQNLLLLLLELGWTGVGSGSRRQDLQQDPEDLWLEVYSAWRQRFALIPAQAPVAQENALSEGKSSDLWPAPAQGYLTTWQWHQATGEGLYRRLDAADSLSLQSPPSSDLNVGQKLRPQRIPLPETFVVEIPQGSVHVGHYPRHLYASFGSAILTRRGELLTDLSLCLPPPEFLDQDYWPDHLQHHPILGLPHLPPPIRLDGPVALLPLGAVNYFHWMVDILPALDILRRAGLLNHPIPILIQGYQGKPFQRQTLVTLGIPPERILSFEALGGSHVQAQILIVPSAAGPVGCLTPRGLGVLRQLGQDSQVRSEPGPRRIYISRSRARWRRVVNEAEVLACLQPLGFVSVQLETLSLPAQIALMQGAEAVIGIHGAGLTNLVFCQPQTTVIEIFPSNAVLPYFWTIAQVAELRYFPWVAPVCDPALVSLLASPDLDREDAWVRIPELLSVLEQAGLTC
ncbi:glycosyltransferase 61 family protein [Synechococcus sp. Nb3U1]|uniref:glycosyltransferase 61 family protein n=1 Tax=Synechococcus sp. Nb3U1 TaxID=1914529 RepID=UPI001F15927C|nr:glycosyltransferase 61 family protein [Synechococcus sp. Nb3U1]MCF2970054.1 glycosyltransferase 61 family protein [Synechococcus sp. Nb3U1]